MTHYLRTYSACTKTELHFNHFDSITVRYLYLSIMVPIDYIRQYSDTGTYLRTYIDTYPYRSYH